MRSSRLGGTLVAFVLGVAAVVFAGDRLPGEYMNEFHTGYTTAHIPWAKPYVGGRTRAFFIAPWTAAREVTELAQRLDLELHGETTFCDRELGGTDRYTAQVEGTSPEDKLRRLRRKLAERYEVFVIANFPFKSLPTEIQYHITRQVVEGAGLVLVYKRPCPKEFFRHPDREAAKRIASGVPFGGLDFYRNVYRDHYKLPNLDAVGPKLVSAYRAKKGRVVQIDFGIQSGARYGGFCLTPREPFTFRSQTQYEYHQMLVINAVLWAAGREPPVRVGPLPLRKVRGMDLPRQVGLAVEARRDVGRATAEVTIRNAWGEAEHTVAHSLRLRAGANRVPLDIPYLCGGGHYIDVRVRKGEKAVGWGSLWLAVQPPVAIAELKVDKLSFEREGAGLGSFRRASEPAPSATGRVRLKAPAPAGLSLEIRLLDNYQRLYAKGGFPIKEGASEAWFGVPTDAALSLAGRCRARLVRGGKLLDRTEAEFFTRRRRLHVFPTLLWGTYPGILGHWANAKLRSAGFNTILAPHYSLKTAEHGEHRQIGAIARDDMLCVPYTTHITRWRNDALGDDATYAKHREGALAMVRHLKPFGPLVYSLGDENSILAEIGFQPGDKPGFIQHLKRTYGSLERLNAAWGTGLARWEDAAPITLADAKAKRRYAAYHDTETYREALYARWHRWYHGLFKQEDPYARVGSEGSQPGNLEETIRGLEFWGPYRRRVDNTLLRSLAPRSLVRGNWFGGYVFRRRDVPGLRRFLWDTFLDGNNLFEIYCCYTAETIFKSDLTFGYWTEAFLPDLREIVDGIGQLAAASLHQTDPVAIYHSQASLHAARLHARFGRRDTAHDGALGLIEDAGYQPRYITSRDVRSGELCPEHVLLARRRPVLGSEFLWEAPKLLLIAYGQALSDEEVKAIVEFVDSGGLLIADICPAIFDGHSTLRKAGGLDELFGIRRAPDLVRPARGRLVMPATRLTLGTRSVSLPAIELPNVDADAAVSIAGGRALAKVGETPAIVVRGLGKGMAVLLNFPFSACRRLDDGSRHAFRRLIGGLTGLFDLEPKCRVFARDGTALLGCRAPRFEFGGTTTVMLLPRRSKEGDRRVRARVELAERAHIYDQRTGAYLGRRSSVRLKLEPTSATLLSLLRHRVRGIKIKGERRVEPGAVARLEFMLRTDREPPPLGHVVRVKLINPAGKELWLGARTLYIAFEQGIVGLPFAYNAMPGTWTVVVRDVPTRKEARFRIRVTEPGEKN